MSVVPLQSFVTTADNVRLAIYDWPTPHTRPILLAHPTGFHGRVWDPVAQRLISAGFHPFALDFRGHGDSDRTPGRYDWSCFALDVHTVATTIDLAGDPSGIAVGCSKGGAALILAELDAPTTFANLWCYEPIIFPIDTPLPPDAEIPLAAASRKRRAIWPSPDAARAAYASKPPLNALHPDTLDAYVMHGLRALPDGEWELKCAPADEAEMYGMGIQHDAYARLASLAAPTVIACGEHTDALTPDFAARLVERIPRARLDVWSGAGHFGPLEDPDRGVAALVREYT